MSLRGDVFRRSSLPDREGIASSGKERPPRNDAMDLRAFGVGPRTWLEVLERDFKDRVLIWFGVAILAGSIILGLFGYGNFWVPDFMLAPFG